MVVSFQCLVFFLFFFISRKFGKFLLKKEAFIWIHFPNPENLRRFVWLDLEKKALKKSSFQSPPCARSVIFDIF